jgi:inosine-uridine nucleoside N-ribohydrolase
MKIVHDCDPGNDDALAILAALGSASLDLTAVTTGAGHLAANRTTRNAAITLALAGASHVPVFAGAEVPLVRERLIAAVLDENEGLDRDRSDLPAVPIETGRQSAEAIAELALRHEGLVIVTTGPLTNLALALRLRPEIAARIARIVILGGAWGLGNKTAAAEWNMLCDPEAAHIVFSSGAPITLAPIDSAAQVLISPHLVSDARAIGGRVGVFAAELLSSLRSTHRPGPMKTDNAPLNDPLAILVAAQPSLVKTLKARVEVELAGRHTYGRTVIDFAGRGGLPPNCEVVVEYDVDATAFAFLDALRRVADRQKGQL